MLTRGGSALAPICDLADHYDARVIMEDSHAINVALVALELRMPFAPLAEIRSCELEEAARKSIGGGVRRAIQRTEGASTRRVKRR